MLSNFTPVEHYIQEGLVAPFSEKGVYQAHSIILTFSKKVYDRIVSAFPVVYTHVTMNAEYNIHEVAPGILAYLSPMTGPMAVMLLEELRNCFFFSRVLSFGSCGSLTEELKADTLFLPTLALGDDGISHHYYRLPEIPVSGWTVLHDYLEDRDLKPTTGFVWTTSSLYRETPAKVQYFRDKRFCKAVDMEVAAIAAFCKKYKLRYFPLLFPLDYVHEEGWEIRDFGTPNEYLIQSNLFYLCKNFAISLPPIEPTKQ